MGKVVFFNLASRKKSTVLFFAVFADHANILIFWRLFYFWPQFPSHFIANKKKREGRNGRVGLEMYMRKYKLRWFQKAPFSVFLPTPWKFVVNRWLCLCPFVEKCIQKMAIINCIHQSNSSTLQPRRICSRISGISKQYIINTSQYIAFCR